MSSVRVENGVVPAMFADDNGPPSTVLYLGAGFLLFTVAKFITH